jgi:hypothetical protein
MNRIKYRNIGLSLIILIAWTGLILFLSVHSKGDWGDGFALYSWFELTRVISLGGAAVFFLLRVFRLIKQQSNLGYCLFAVSNCFIGIVGIVLYIYRGWDVSSLHEFLLSLLVAAILLADIVFFSAVFARRGK